MTTTTLYSLSANDVRTYIFAGLFIAGNIVLPQLCHVNPQGGLTWLPIYFFTLIAAYKYGWRVGLLTALLSPLANNLLFAMPPAGALPAIISKSVLLALAAAFAAHRFHKVSLLLLFAVVLTYQVSGTAAEWVWTGCFTTAAQDFRIGLPGMVVQVMGGWLLLKHVLTD